MAAQGDYWTAVYHCQQAAEKMTKAVLFKYKIIEMKEHVISGLFASRILRYRRSKELNQVYRYLAQLERHVNKARYPIQEDDEILLPMERYDARDAADAITKAEYIINTLQKLLDEPEPS
ncbi:MAG: HEPN domain-containing protein [Anaerolineae bacterium]|nr:HEPN domain-containing protein [Anaerolineae bacterium]